MYTPIQQLHISLILQFVEEFGRPPKYHDNRSVDWFPNGAAFRRSFGTLNKALTAAGVTPTLPTDPATGKRTPTTKTYYCTQCKSEMVLSGHDLHMKEADMRKQKANGKPGNVFCSRSCNASYNNCHKQYGYRRSKFESYVESRLTEDYPILVITFNGKDAIGSELDIFIEDFNLAIELNGIVHYKPIFGDEKLISVQTNDAKKLALCASKGIELHTIDVSGCSWKKHYPYYYDQVKCIIDSHMM